MPEKLGLLQEVTNLLALEMTLTAALRIRNDRV
jgi:hypothetical protein